MNILHILLGWLLGLCTQPIQQRISNWQKRSRAECLILTDLKETKTRMTPVPISIYSRYGQLDNEKLNWSLKNNPQIVGEHNKMLESGLKIKDIIDFFNKNMGDPERVSYCKKINLFILDSDSEILSLMDSLFVQKVLEVKFRIMAINDDIDYFRSLLTMTFDSAISEDNAQIIREQIQAVSLAIADNMVIAVNKINEILDLKKQENNV